MKTKKDYLNIFREVASDQGVKGQVAEILSQMLANASYINEVENISTVREASIESASLLNSKIQHCMDQMYSVFRGNCPRVLLKFQSYKYLTFNPYDVIYTSNRFNIYYLGYLNTNYKEDSNDTIINSEGDEEESTENNVTILNSSSISELEDIITYSNITIPPTNESNEYVIIGLLTTNLYTTTKTLDYSNTYYVNFNRKNLSSDIYVRVNDETQYKTVTREFSEHVLNEDSFFDLTTTDYGLRIYIPEAYRNTNDKVEIGAFEFSNLSSFNSSELSKIKIQGTKMIDFDDEDSWCNYDQNTTGVILINEIPRNSSTTMHYKASIDRFVNSFLRSNTDIGTRLEETYPEKVRTNGTTYEYEAYAANFEECGQDAVTGETLYRKVGDNETSVLRIYYIPYSNNTLLTEVEKQNYKNRVSYYVTEDIDIEKGTEYKAKFNLNIEVYSSDVSISDDISDILSKYEYKFNMNLGSGDGKDSEGNEELNTLRSEIIPLINKISNVRRIKDFTISYSDSNDSTVYWNDWETTEKYEETDTETGETSTKTRTVTNTGIKNNIKTSYFTITQQVNTIVYIL